MPRVPRGLAFGFGSLALVFWPAASSRLACGVLAARLPNGSPVTKRTNKCAGNPMRAQRARLLDVQTSHRQNGTTMLVSLHPEVFETKLLLVVRRRHRSG